MSGDAFTSSNFNSPDKSHFPYACG
jgi:hypothetical protein